MSTDEMMNTFSDMSSDVFINKIKQLKENLKQSMSINIKEFENLEKHSR